VTGLWTNDRDTLAGALRSGLMPHYLNPVQRAAVIEALLGSGAVRVLDPDNTELVEQGARAIYSSTWRMADWDLAPRQVRDLYRAYARAHIVALRQL
jgi:hypothetical protein